MYFIAIMVFVMSCNGPKSQKIGQSSAPEKMVMEISDFMKIAIDSLEKEVNIKGTVNHVCSHSGQRCFIVDPTGEQSVRVEAKGEINSFNKELVGMDITVTGTVRERRLSNRYIDERESKVKEEDAEEGGEHCSAELQNIQAMRDWMKENNKDYYSIIYLDGTKYEIIQAKENEKSL